jgi:hypothetical protein
LTQEGDLRGIRRPGRKVVPQGVAGQAPRAGLRDAVLLGYVGAIDLVLTANVLEPFRDAIAVGGDPNG